MAASIRSLRNGITPIDDGSRDDLVATDVVLVSALDAATTYAWTLVFVPEGSSATFSGSTTAVSPGSFTIDVTGAYLVRLIVDAGLSTESTQYVRLRALTTDLGLKLVAAGERRDGTGIIPVDVDTEGWANEQNANLKALEAATTYRVPYHLNMAPVAAGSVSYRGWVSETSTLVGVRAYMTVINAAGAYDLTVQNVATGNTVLVSSPFDMNTLVADTVTNLTLSATAADLAFAALGKWTITLTSDNPAFTGSGIYIELLFEV